MKPCLSYLCINIALVGLAYAQAPAPVCGLPHLRDLPPAETTVLYKTGFLTGDTTFFIREHYTSTKLIEVDFYLMHTAPTFEIYAEVAELDSGNVDSIAVARLAAVFQDHTFPGSIDPNLGIKAIAESVFGPPPDIDDNSKVYILLIDVRDDFVLDSSDTYVAGYFDPLDQKQFGQGNHADIIYLDTNPGTFSEPGALKSYNTLAHEYQHLIHYDQDEYEDHWVNEGLSELSPVLMGLPHREFTHYLIDTNQRLDYFDNKLADYARSGLFFLYTWVQLGTAFIRDLIGNTETGVQAVNSVLSMYGRPALSDFVHNWHLANYLQTEGVFGYRGLYSIPRPAMHDAVLSFPQEGVGGDVQRLGARWTLITGGSNLFIYASRSWREPGLTLINGDNSTLISAPQLSTIGFQDSTFGEAYHDLVVLADASTAILDSVAYSLYIDAESGFDEVTLSYDGNQGPDTDVPWIGLGEKGVAGEAALSFTIPPNASEIFTVDFMSLTSDSVSVRIYHNELKADSIIYTAPVPAPLGQDWTTHRLPRGFPATSGLLFVSVRSTANALAYNEHTAVSYSHYWKPGEADFHPLDNFTADEKELIGNWLIRLTYLIPDTTREPLVIPVIASQFYPNPLVGSPGARIIVTPGYRVDLVLYDILGRELFRTTRPAESTDPLFWNGRLRDGRLAPSGVYLARVIAGSTVINRKLVLIR